MQAHSSFAKLVLTPESDQGPFQLSKKVQQKCHTSQQFCDYCVPKRTENGLKHSNILHINAPSSSTLTTTDTTWKQPEPINRWRWVDIQVWSLHVMEYPAPKRNELPVCATAWMPLGNTPTHSSGRTHGVGVLTSKTYYRRSSHSKSKGGNILSFHAPKKAPNDRKRKLQTWEEKWMNLQIREITKPLSIIDRTRRQKRTWKWTTR